MVLGLRWFNERVPKPIPIKCPLKRIRFSYTVLNGLMVASPRWLTSHAILKVVPACSVVLCSDTRQVDNLRRLAKLHELAQSVSCALVANGAEYLGSPPGGATEVKKPFLRNQRMCLDKCWVWLLVTTFPNLPKTPVKNLEVGSCCGRPCCFSCARASGGCDF